MTKTDQWDQPPFKLNCRKARQDDEERDFHCWGCRGNTQPRGKSRSMYIPVFVHWSQKFTTQGIVMNIYFTCRPCLSKLFTNVTAFCSAITNVFYSATSQFCVQGGWMPGDSVPPHQRFPGFGFWNKKKYDFSVMATNTFCIGYMGLKYSCSVFNKNLNHFKISFSDSSRELQSKGVSDLGPFFQK